MSTGTVVLMSLRNTMLLRPSALKCLFNKRTASSLLSRKSVTLLRTQSILSARSQSLFSRLSLTRSRGETSSGLKLEYYTITESRSSLKQEVMECYKQFQMHPQISKKTFQDVLRSLLV